MIKKIKLQKVVNLGWFLTISALFLYSFTQIDLNLTLTRFALWQPIQKAFQAIGYFNRPLSLALYLIILFSLSGFYFLILQGVKRKWLTARQIRKLILITALLLWFSYNAFSYDIFNYVFDSKIVTHYGLSPYQYRAQDFPEDPMLGFMHWTHRYYPYGPIWLAFSIPLSFLGFQKFLLTVILFKALAVGSYLAACRWLEKILGEVKPKIKTFGLAVFAFNPLVIIESLVAAHNDILMMALALGGFWFLIKKRPFWAYGKLFLSAGVKFVTALLIPIFLLVSYWQRKKRKINWEQIWLLSFALMVAGVAAAINRDELKPWYWLYPFSFVALVPQKKWVFWPSVSLSLGVLLHYAPFFYLGNWDPPVSEIKNGFTVGFLIAGLILAVFSGKKGKDWLK